MNSSDWLCKIVQVISLRWLFWKKFSSHFASYFPHNFIRNISTNISTLEQWINLKLGELSSLIIIYNITISWLYLLLGKELYLEEKPQKERQEIKGEGYEGKQETQPKLNVPELFLPQKKEQPPSLPTVLYLNIDDEKVFEKVIRDLLLVAVMRG